MIEVEPPEECYLKEPWGLVPYAEECAEATSNQYIYPLADYTLLWAFWAAETAWEVLFGC
jgi:hypothetical protein